jgi:hypothetical protein
MAERSTKPSRMEVPQQERESGEPLRTESTPRRPKTGRQSPASGQRRPESGPRRALPRGRSSRLRARLGRFLSQARRPGLLGRLEHGIWPRLIVGFAILALALVLASYPIDRHLRTVLEARMNSDLRGYKVSLSSAHLRLVGLALTLNGLVLRQEANPEPPVAFIPHLKASVEWAHLLTGRLVADAVFMRPQLHVDLPQMEAEAASQVPFRERGWKEAFESIYPAKFNRVTVVDGQMTYVDVDPAHPLEVTRFQLEARNIRNIESPDRVYPSPLHVEAVLFGSGKAVIDGNANFLTKPYPGVHCRYVLLAVPLDRFRPIVARENLSLQGGTLTSRGEVEHSPTVYLLHVKEVTIRGAHLDYIHSPATAAAESSRAAAVARAARRVSSEPGVVFLVDAMRLEDSDVGLINRDKNPPYRIYVDHAQLAVTDLSNHDHQHVAKAWLRGRFMGSGAAHAEATFRTGKGSPDFDLSLAVEGTKLTAMSDLLRTYVNFGADAGTFSLYTQIRVANGHIEGYVKPLFKDLAVHTDEKGGLGHKIYNRLVQAASKLLENRNDQVATEISLAGPVKSPRTSTTWEVIGNLVQNAFFKAILPGFEKQSHQKS